MAARQKGDYTEILIRQKVISPDQLAEAKQMSKESSIKLPDALVRLGYATGEEVMRAMAEQFGLDYVNLNEVSIPAAVIELVPESVVRENAVLPLAEGDGRLTIIVSDPNEIDTIEKLRFILNRQIDIALAPRESILEAINRYYGQTIGESADSMLQEFTDTAIDFTETVDDGSGAEDEVDETSAPIVRLVQLLITEAVQLRASDIHIEPFEDRIRVRYRIDGLLTERDSPPRRLLGAILSRVKILGPAGHCRTSPHPGRPHQDHHRREGIGPSRERHSHLARPVGGHADPRQGQHQGGPAAVGLLRRGLREAEKLDPAAQRDHPGHGADGLGKNHVVVCRAE